MGLSIPSTVFAPLPAGHVHILEQKRGMKAPTHTATLVSLGAAMVALQAAAKAWQATKPGRKATLTGTELVLRYSDGKAAALLSIDAYPAPAASPNKSS